MTTPRERDGGKRDDQKFADDIGIAFAMYCDTNGLTAVEVGDLMEACVDAVTDNAENCVDQRAATP